MTRKPKRRHSVELEILDEQDKRPYRYVLEGERDLLPRPRFYSRCPDAGSVSPEYAEFLLRHIVQQRHQELEEEKGEREKRESERRRLSELPIDITDRPKRLIPVDPIISPFDSGEDKVPGKGTYIPYRPTEHPFSPDTGLKSPHSPLRSRFQIPHKESTDLEDSIDSEADSIMTATTKELIIPLPKLSRTLIRVQLFLYLFLKVRKGKIQKIIS